MKTKFMLLAVVVILILVNSAKAQHRYVETDGGVAFDGYDLVSYFKNPKPLKGRQQHKMEYDGLTLYFASAKNLAEFKKKPDDYLPAYGGYCAIAVSNDNYVSPNFANYSIQDGKLLFFEVRGFWNGRTEWEKDPELHEILADKHYREEFDQSENN